ncbi:hypothetical protein TPA0910_52010 [Streptomyces hygroscopicus subsp. sporocinereus]|uniref:Uncharacterized protein n=1 Tax=Streptomyces hygroscopicus TaxID=1912 RepID=A0ABQ3U574_STRHY|nr:hypothetical protein [Streptomyces hygroscopicus]GHJ30768.1 hypothetical protein TPA0910_52010 [Streptomyces hygroscopicus]
MGFWGRTAHGGSTWRRIGGLLIVVSLFLPGIGPASADTIGRARTADAPGAREPSIAVPYRVDEL